MKNKKGFTVALAACLAVAILLTGCSAVGKVQGLFDRIFSGSKKEASNTFEAKGYVVTFSEVTRGTEAEVFGYDIKGMLLENFSPFEGFDFFFVRIDKMEKDGVEQDLFVAFEELSLSEIFLYEDGEEVDSSLSISNEEKGYIALVLTLPDDHADSFDVEIRYESAEE